MMCVINKTQKAIDRYDPVTGAFLGRFGAGYLTGPADIIVSGQDRVLVLDNNVTNYQSCAEFQTSTGLLLRTIYSGSPYYGNGLTLRNGVVYTYSYVNATSTALYGFDYSTGALVSSASSSTTANLLDMWNGPGGQLFTTNGANGIGTLNVSTGAFTATGAANVGTIQEGTSFGANMYVMGSGGLVAGFNTTGVNNANGGSGLSTGTGIVAGHAYLYGVGSNASGGLISRINPNYVTNRYVRSNNRPVRARLHHLGTGARFMGGTWSGCTRSPATPSPLSPQEKRKNEPQGHPWGSFFWNSRIRVGLLLRGSFLCSRLCLGGSLSNRSGSRSN